MTSFQLFKGMTGIDSEFLLQVERQDSPVSRRLHTKKLWLIAAIIALTLLLVGCAVAYVTILWGSPKEMIAGLYGENTGFDSAAPGEGSDPVKPGATWTIPGYEKLPVEETVAQELEKWVSPVGKSISAPGYKLTVDAYVYDSATQCHLRGEYGLRHGWPPWRPPRKLPEFQPVWLALPDPRENHRSSPGLHLLFPCGSGCGDGIAGILPGPIRRTAQPGIRRAAKITVVDADDLIDDIATHVDDLQSWAYFMLVNRAFNQAHMDEMVCVSLPDSGSLPYKTFGQGGIYVNSLCVWIRPSHYADRGDAIKTLIFHMTDGTDFVVMDDLTDNTVFKRIIEHDDLLCMLNSAINIEKIQSVEVAGEFGSATLEGDVD